MKTTSGLRLFAVAMTGLLGLAAGSPARADTAAQGTLPSYAELPVGEVSEPPTKKAPWGVGGGERAAGFVVSQMDGYLTVAPTRGETTPPPGGAPVCYSMAQPVGAAMPPDPPEMEWAMAQPSVSMPGPGNGGTVTVLHSEKVVAVDATHATLEWADAWIDPNTRGARLIKKGALPLRLMRELPGGGQVLAGRDAERVHVVVVTSPTPDKVNFSGRDQLLTLTAAGMNNAAGCRHLRVGLRADKGAADNATVFMNVPLPALEDAAAKAKGSGTPSVRVRSLAVSASVSWSSRDAEPVVSVAAGWRSRERNLSAQL